MAGRVLVIDDDELSREVLGVLLADVADAVEVASSGDEALATLGRSPGKPEIVLMDMQMPGVSGVDLAGRLRLLCGGAARLIAMSGSRLPERAREAFDGFLLKPFSMEEFAEAARGGEAGVVDLAASGDEPLEEVLNVTIFRGFAAAMGKESLEELYGTCLRDAAMRWREMRRAKAEGDEEAFRRAAHVIKGGLGMLGAVELQGICGRMEREGLSNANLVTFAEFPVAIGKLRRMLMAHGLELAPEEPDEREVS